MELNSNTDKQTNFPKTNYDLVQSHLFCRLQMQMDQPEILSFGTEVNTANFRPRSADVRSFANLFSPFSTENGSFGFFHCFVFSSLPKDKLLVWSNVKAFADNTVSVT